MILLFWGRGTAHLLVYLPSKFLAVHRKAGNVSLCTLTELLCLGYRQVKQLFLNHVIGIERKVDQVGQEIGKVRWRSVFTEEVHLDCILRTTSFSTGRLGTECLEGLCLPVAEHKQRA